METNDFNFEEMRSQIAILKNKLNNQDIVTNKLLREIMHSKKSDIDKTKRLQIICAFLSFIIFPFETYLGVLSMEFSTATCLMIFFCLACTFYIHRPVDRVNLMTENLATVAEIMERFKHHYDMWIRYVTPTLIIPWLALACYEFGWKNAPDGINPWLLCVPLFIGAAIGLFIGITYHNKAVNAAKSIMDQIREV